MRDTPEDLLTEWVVATLAHNPPKNRDDAQEFREHAIDDLEEEGVTEEMIDSATKNDFGAFVMTLVGPSDPKRRKR